MKRRLISIIAIACALFLIASCDNEMKTKTYTVSFNSDGGSEVDSVTVEEGKTAARPADPSKEGYIFIGWMLGEEEYDFSLPVTKDIALDAFWVEPSKTARIGKNAFDTLDEAVRKAKSGDTVILIQDAAGNGIGLYEGGDNETKTATKDIVIDFGDHTYTIDGSLQGSEGTVSQAFHLEKGCKVTLKNGTITSVKASMLVQNYCDLTLRDVTLDGSHLVGKYTLSNNFGNTTVTGNTRIIAKEGNCAFDVYYWPKNGYGDGLTVTFDEHFTGEVIGNIEYGSDGTENGKANIAEKAKLVIKSGSFGGSFSTDNLSDTKATGITITGGSFTDLASAITYVDSGATINLAANFTLVSGIANGVGKSRNITFKGDGNQTVDVITEAVNAEGGKLQYHRGSSFTFENLTIQAGEGNFDGIVCNELTFKNCTIKGKLTLFGKATFINCVFDNTMTNQYSIWTWGGTDVTFERCIFNTNGKAILLYGGASGSNPTNLVVNNCTFNDRNNGAAKKAAIEIGNDYNATYTLTVNNATVTGFAEGKNTGSKLWANKNSMDAAHLTVIIDGTKVQ